MNRNTKGQFSYKEKFSHKVYRTAVLSFLFLGVVVAVRQSPVGAEAVVAVEQVQGVEVVAKTTQISKAVKQPLQDEICYLGFIANNTKGKAVVLNQAIMQSIEGHNCKDSQILVRLAWYESSFDPSARNGQYKGLYQIGKAGRIDCNQVGAISDADCALYIYRTNPKYGFESRSNNLNSFEGLN